MITTKSPQEIEYMREAGRIVALAHEAIKPYLVEGTSTKQINDICESTILKYHATPSFKGLYGFCAAVCTSVNSTLVHGIPNENTILKNGDIISVDIGACYKGYHGDSAWSYIVGDANPRDIKLLERTETALMAGLEAIKDGCTVGDIGHAVQKVANKYNLGIVRELVGHGVGDKVHLAPDVPNFGVEHRGPVLHSGNVIAVEPMLNLGTPHIYMLDDDWTIVTDDEQNSAHFEHTVLVTDNGYEILTRRDIELDPEDMVK
jgi:methionyl aminopeptidase